MNVMSSILFGHCISFAGTLATTSVVALLVTRLIFPELSVRGPAKSAFYYLLRKHNVLINAHIIRNKSIIAFIRR